MTLKEAWDEVKKAADNEDPEETLRALGEFFKLDAATANHETVKMILEGLSETMRQASTDYYVSTK